MVEPQVERQLRITAAAAEPSASAAASGAGLARTAEQAGRALHVEQLQDARVERELRENAQWSEFQVGFAGAREQFGALAREGRKSDDPGHANALRQQWTEQSGKLTEGLPPRLQERARSSIAQWSAGFLDREAAWEDLRQSEITVERTRDQLLVSEGRTRRLENPEDYRAELLIQMEAIDGLSASDEIRKALADEAEQRLAVSYLRGMIDRDPQTAKALLNSDTFDGVLTGDQVQSLLNSSDVEIRAVERAIERERDAQKANVREQLQTFEEAERQGLIEDPATFDVAIAQATALGDNSLALKLEGLKVDQAFVRIWGPENANSLQREARLTELAGSDSRSVNENRELAFLRKHSSAWSAQEASDPVGQAAARGGTGAPPPIDISDPDSLARRGQWAAARSAEGVPVPAFTKVEARQLAQIYDSGRAGEEQVLSILNQLPPGQAMQSARQIDAGDTTLPIIATLDETTRNMARRGREVLKRDKATLSGPMDEDLALEEDIAVLRQDFERALTNIPPDQREAIRDTAEQILAGYIDKTNASFDGQAYELSLNMALGAEGTGPARQGGLDRWGGRPYLLPDGVTARGFRNAVIASARASEDPPVNLDGTPAKLSRAYPVAVDPGVYEFHTGSGEKLRRKSGAIYRVRVGAQ